MYQAWQRIEQQPTQALVAGQVAAHEARQFATAAVVDLHQPARRGCDDQRIGIHRLALQVAADHMPIIVGEEHEVAGLQFDGFCGGEQARTAVALHHDVEEHDVLGISKKAGIAMPGLRYCAPRRGEPGIQEYCAPEL